MSSGNSMVDGADKELSRGDCACGGDWDPIDWCALHNEECLYKEFCAMELPNLAGCPERKEMLKCSRCGARVEAQ